MTSHVGDWLPREATALPFPQNKHTGIEMALLEAINDLLFLLEERDLDGGDSRAEIVPLMRTGGQAKNILLDLDQFSRTHAGEARPRLVHVQLPGEVASRQESASNVSGGQSPGPVVLSPIGDQL